MSLAITDGDELHHRPFVRIHGVGVDSIPIVIAEMFDLPYDFALIIPNDHFTFLQSKLSDLRELAGHALNQIRSRRDLRPQLSEIANRILKSQRTRLIEKGSHQSGPPRESKVAMNQRRAFSNRLIDRFQNGFEQRDRNGMRIPNRELKITDARGARSINNQRLGLPVLSEERIPH